MKVRWTFMVADSGEDWPVRAEEWMGVVLGVLITFDP